MADYDCRVPEIAREMGERESGKIHARCDRIRQIFALNEVQLQRSGESQTECVRKNVRTKTSSMPFEKILAHPAASVGDIVIDANVDVPVGCGAAVINDQLTVYLELKGHVDAEKETKSFEKKLKLVSELNAVRENYERRHV